MNDAPTLSVIFPLQIIHGALVGGVFVMSCVLPLSSPESLNTELTTEWIPFIGTAIAVAALSLIVSKVFFDKLLAQLKGDLPITDKINGYRRALLMRFAMLEFPALFGLIVTFLSGSIITLAVAYVMMLFLTLQRPNKTDLTEALELRHEEALLIN